MTTTGAHQLPRWLKRRIPKGNANHFTARLIEESTSRPSATTRCPNRMECYARKTATFGDPGESARARGFRSAAKGSLAVDPAEPDRLAMPPPDSARHVVITCVTRDFPTEAEHFAAASPPSERPRRPSILPPILAETASRSIGSSTLADVYKSQQETVRGSTERAGRKADYGWTPRCFAASGPNPAIHTKTD